MQTWNKSGTPNVCMNVIDSMGVPEFEWEREQNHIDNAVDIVWIRAVAQTNSHTECNMHSLNYVIKYDILRVK